MDIYSSRIINSHSTKLNEITEETTDSMSITWYK